MRLIACDECRRHVRATRRSTLGFVLSSAAALSLTGCRTMKPMYGAPAVDVEVSAPNDRNVEVLIRQGDVTRVLDATALEFTADAERMLGDHEARETLKAEMVAAIRSCGVTDPEAEFWIELDSTERARFGTRYTDHVDMSGTREDLVIELEVECTRPPEDPAWTCK